MNLKKILTGVVAGAMAVSSLALNAFAEAEKTEVDTSKWQIAAQGYTTSWGGWQSATSDEGVLTLETTVGKIMEANSIDDIKDFGGFNVQVWHIAEADDTAKDNDVYDAPISLTYSIKIGDVVDVKDKTEDFEVNKKYGAATIGAYPQSDNNFKADDKVSIEVAPYVEEAPAPDDTQQPAPPATEGLETALYVGNSVDWNIVSSESVFVAIGNEYTYSVSGLDIAPDKLTVIYIKDVAVENKEAEKSDIDPVKVTVTSLKINGNEVAVKEGVPTGLNENGVFDIAYFNTWGDSFIDLPEENINSVEITVKVEKADPAPVDTEATDPEATDPEATDPEATNPEDTSAAAAGTGDSTPTGTGDNNQPTGIAIAIVPAVIAAAGVIVAKKRK
ncbi:MAG: hypothetical protein K2J79_09035 [Ruminiclostridium sp.]|nr:hypothetical protein [Ruminiclostridium sp.]